MPEPPGPPTGPCAGGAGSGLGVGCALALRGAAGRQSSLSRRPVGRGVHGGRFQRGRRTAVHQLAQRVADRRARAIHSAKRRLRFALEIRNRERPRRLATTSWVAALRYPGAARGAACRRGRARRSASSEQGPGAFSISAPFSFESTRADYSAGAFAEVGAQWLITSNLGLGATWSANVQAGRANLERLSATGFGGPERTRTAVNTLSATLGASAIRGTMYL